MTKLFEKYSEMLKGDTLTEQNIIYLKSRISGQQKSLTDNEVEIIREHLFDCEYNITEKQSIKGMKYLMRKCFKNNGQKRATKQLEFMPDHFFTAIKDFERFTFVGFETIQYNVNYFYSPIYLYY